MEYKEKIVWIGHSGYDNGGSATLGVYFSKLLGIHTLFRCEKSKDEEIVAYQNLSQLKDLLDKIKPRIILLFPDITHKPITKDTKEFFELIFKYQEDLNSKIIMIDCTRNGVLLGKRDNDELMSKFEEIFTWKFDCIWSIAGNSRKKWEKFTKDYKIIDINLYEMSNSELEEREVSIGYISRFVAIKGVGRLVNTILNYVNKNDTEIPFIHLGNDHSPKDWENKKVISGPIGVVTQFAKSTSDKTPKEGFSIKSNIEEELECGKYNIYPRFNLHDKEKVFSKVGIAICPTLARISKKEVDETKLFPSFEKDKDDKYLDKNRDYWKLAMEYVNYEFIDYGIPVMFSRDYCLAYDPLMITKFPSLIYDNLEECLEYCVENYEDIIKQSYKQREWLQEKLDNVKETVVEELLSLLKEDEN